MRVDKFLKVSRILKRRTVAHDACEASHVNVNGRNVKPSHTLKAGDIIEIAFASNTLKVEVLSLNEKASKAEAQNLYKVL